MMFEFPWRGMAIDHIPCIFFCTDCHHGVDKIWEFQKTSDICGNTKPIGIMGYKMMGHGNHLWDLFMG